MAKASETGGGDAASAVPEAPAAETSDEPSEPQQDPEASWQRFRDESKTIFKEAINEWADERNVGLGNGTQASGATGTGRPGGSDGAGDGAGSGARTAATTRGAAGKEAPTAPGGFFKELGFVVFGKPKRK